VGFFSSNLSADTKWCSQTFPPIFGIFAIFDRNFSKIVAPSMQWIYAFKFFNPSEKMVKKT